MRSGKLLSMAVAASLMYGGAALADTGVEVTFSNGLQKIVSRVDGIEKKREALFRKYQDDTIVGRVRSNRRFANSYYNDVNWANEQLIANAEDYGVEAMLVALIREDIQRAGLADQDPMIRVHIKRMRVANHSLARLSGISTYVTGTISLVDRSTGQAIRSADVYANLVVDPTVDSGYKGPDWAFPDVDENNRVGPALAYFAQKGLEKLYPDAEFPKPVTITYVNTSS